MRDRQQRRSTINRGLFAVSVLSSAGGLALTAYAQQPKQGQMLILAACSGREQTAVAPHATEGYGSSSPPRASSLAGVPCAYDPYERRTNSARRSNPQ